MSQLLIRNCTLLGPEGPETGRFVLCKDDKIAEIDGGRPSETGGEILDAQGGLLTPGFVDLHCHSGDGRHVGEGNTDAVRHVARAHVSHGLTGFLAAIEGDDLDALALRLESIRQCNLDGPTDGARCLGTLIEGPYLSPGAPGAMIAETYRKPDLNEVDQILEAIRPAKLAMTVAPEIEGAIEVIERLVEGGAVAALGHTLAGPEDVERGADAGMSHVTHLFNAMGKFHHREVGAIGAALVEDRLSAEIIADGHHVNPRTLEIAYRCKGPDRLCLITDHNAMGKVGERLIDSRGREVIFGEEAAWTPDGKLVGSRLTMDLAVRNILRFLSIPLDEALGMASTVPARVLGLDDQLGAIEPGYLADLVLLDKDLNVAATIVGGQVLYRNN